MKVVIAPDKFKGSLSAMEAAAAIAEGVLDACPHATVDLCPMADGGEGTVAAMVAATGGQYITADVFDAVGSPIRARFGLLGSEGGQERLLPGEIGLLGAMADSDQGHASSRHVAVVETAAASGIQMLSGDRRDPLRTTTFGTGQLILAALDAGANEIILGVGGSATVDGGVGCAQALGVTFLGGDGLALHCGLGGGDLDQIADIDLSDRDPRLSQVRIRVACDVSNPLLGPQGAARVFGPQKGATSEGVSKLEANLTHLAELLRRKLSVDVASMPGAGAAGGLGAGLVAMAGAALESGLPMIAHAVALERRLGGADFVITGEGFFDAQSRHGKVPLGVAKIAQQLGVRALCVCGQATSEAPATFFKDVRTIVSDQVSVAQAMAEAPALLRQRTSEMMRQYCGG